MSLSELAATCPSVPPACTAPSRVEHRHWLFSWVASHSLLAVQLLCLTTAAQFKPETNATHDTQLSVAWHGVLALQRQPRATWLSSQTDPAPC